jgi:signal transduction histidine kinase/CheY-like chemotaxis protein
MEHYDMLAVLPCTITFLSTLPLYVDVGIGDVKSNNIDEALESSTFWSVYLVAVAVSLPMLVDVLTFVVHRDTFFFLERLLLLIACDVPVFLLRSFRNFHRPDILFSSIVSIQAVWILFILFRGIQVSKSEIWTRRRVRACFICYVISQLQPYQNLAGVVGPLMLWLCSGCYFVAILLYLYIYIWYVKELWTNRSEYSAREYMPLFCCTTILFYTVASVFPYFYWKFNVFQYLTIPSLTYMIMLNQSVLIFMTVLPGRIARAQITEVETSLETKKSFIRYIGHEIRTPLNVATIGLDLISASYMPPTSAAAVGGSIHGAAAFGRLSSNHSVRLRRVESNGSNNNNNLWENASAKSDNLNSEVYPFSPTHFGGTATPSKVVRYDVPTTSNLQHHNGCMSPAGMDQDLYSVLTEVRKAIFFGTDILDNLLAYDKLDTQNMVLEKTFIQVADFVSNSLSLFRMHASVKKVNFMIDVEKGLPLLHADEYKIRQVLCNLASNSLKFTPPNGIVAVSVKRYFDYNATHRSKRSSDYLLVQFKDTGIGITKENLPKVFKKIIQFDANTNQKGKGSGLGLFITRGLVELHGGSVSVHSEGLGTGCTFSVVLPFAEKNAGMKPWYRLLPTWIRYCCYSRQFSPVAVDNQERGDGGVDEESEPSQNDVETGTVTNDGKVRVEGNNTSATYVSKQSTKRNSLKNSDRVSAFEMSASLHSIHSASSIPSIRSFAASALHEAVEECSQPSDDKERKVGRFDSDSSGMVPRKIVNNMWANKEPEFVPASENDERELKRVLSLHSVETDDLTNTNNPKLAHSVVSSRSSASKASSTASQGTPHFVLHEANVIHMYSMTSESAISVTGSSANSKHHGSSELRDAKDDVSMALTSRTAAIQSSSGQWLAGYTMLLVDDSNSSLKMLSMLLKKLGGRCITAMDGTEAVHIVRKVLNQKENSVRRLIAEPEHTTSTATNAADPDNTTSIADSDTAGQTGRPHLTVDTARGSGRSQNVQISHIDFILMDNFMPVMNGPEACKQMREVGYTNPIIGLTGHALGDDIDIFRAAGADHVLSKPLDVSTLQQILRSLLPQLAEKQTPGKTG